MSVPNLLAVLAPIAFVVAVGSFVIARAAIGSRQELRGPGTWPQIHRELSRKQRATDRRALRDGQTVEDPSLAFAVVAAAKSLRRHSPRPAQRLLYVFVGVALLAVGALTAWRAVTGPGDRFMLLVMAVLLVDGLIFIALLPVSMHRAKHMAAAERANQALLDSP